MNAVTFPVRADPVSRQSETREKALGLRDLRYFLSVADTGNLGRAARDLNVSQPAISLQLRKLEEGLGTQLLLRHARGVTLTPAGTCLRDRLQTVMRLLASPLDEAAPEPASQSISFAVPAEAGAPLVTPLARAFRSRWPDVTLDVREGSGADLEAWLLHRHVDLAMLQDTSSLPEIEMTPMLTESLGLVAPVHSHLLDVTGPLSLRELAGDALILPGPQHWIRRRLEHAAQQHNVRLNPVLQVDSTTLTKVLIRSGLGCAILPHSSVQDEIAQGGLVFRLIGQPPLSCKRVIAFHRAASNTIVGSFATMACNVITTLVARGAWPHARLIRPRAKGVEAADGPRVSADRSEEDWAP
jgi:LysR family transcriptional regulator, nitrogen assimilation regulatory protein